MRVNDALCALWVMGCFLGTTFPVGCGGPEALKLNPPPLFDEENDGPDIEAEIEPALEEPRGNESAAISLETVLIGCFAFDNACRPLQGVTVTSGQGDIAVTDDTGFVVLPTTVQADTVVIKFQKAGFVTETKLVNLLSGDAPFAEMVMRPGTASYTLDDPGDGGTVNFDRGSITFSPNAFEGMNTLAMSQLTVKVRTIDVTSNDILTAPGDFSGVDESGANVWLNTFGMISVELENNFGGPVYFSKGAKVDMELLLPETIEMAEGTVIPAWHFDEAEGKWVEEGEWTVAPWSRHPEKMAARTTVKHFSWWNIDYPMEVTCIRGTVRLCDGSPAVKTQVLAAGNDYFTVLAASTDEDGAFCVLARVNSSVTVSTTIFDGTSLLTTAETIKTPSTPGTCGGENCYHVELSLPCEGEPGYTDKKILCSR